MTPRTNHPDDGLEVRRAWPARLALGALLVLLGVLYARVPLSPDQFAIQYVAWRVNAGEPLYTGVVDMNWPGIVWLMQPIASLDFDPWFPWRVVDFTVMLIGVLATKRWLRRAFGPGAAAAWVGVYPLVYTSPALYWFAGQPDAVMTHLTLLAVALHLHAWQHSTPRLAARVTAGLAVGAVMTFAVAVKPVAAVFAVALALHTLALVGLRGRSARPATLYLTVAAATGWALLHVAFAVLMMTGSRADDIYQAAWLYNRTAQFVGALPTLELARLAGGWLTNVLHAALLLPGLALWINHRRQRSSAHPPTDEAVAAALLIGLLAVAGLATYAVQAKGFGYHLAPTVAVLLMAFAASVGVAWDHRQHTPALAVLMLAIAGGFSLLKARPHLDHLHAELSPEARPAFLQRFEAGDGLTYDQLDDLDRQLAPLLQSSPPAEPLFVWGESVVINLRQRRPQPTPYYYFLSLTNLRPNTPPLNAWIGKFSQAMSGERGTQPACVGVISDKALAIAQRRSNGTDFIVHRWLNHTVEHATVGPLRIVAHPRLTPPAANPAHAGEAASIER